ncbi:hypothetical protein D3C75_1222010 [compost metagenome]
MRVDGFKEFLKKEPTISSHDAVNTRINRAKIIEDHFDTSLDDLVSDDEITYKTLITLKDNMDVRGNLQNTVRKYYKFVHGKEFPSIKDYELQRS